MSWRIPCVFRAFIVRILIIFSNTLELFSRRKRRSLETWRTWNFISLMQKWRRRRRWYMGTFWSLYRVEPRSSDWVRVFDWHKRYNSNSNYIAAVHSHFASEMFFSFQKQLAFFSSWIVWHVIVLEDTVPSSMH